MPDHIISPLWSRCWLPPKSKTPYCPFVSLRDRIDNSDYLCSLIVYCMERRQKPDWLKIKLPSGNNYKQVKQIVEGNHLHTICSSGRCPNMGECWGVGTATFLILGEICTRSCKFCATLTGKPLPPDCGEGNLPADGKPVS